MAKKVINKAKVMINRLGILFALMTDAKKLCSQEYDEITDFKGNLI